MRQDAIVIGVYDPEWPDAFERERAKVAPVLAPWLQRDIEHMGSTAVPGLPAKSIIDMVAIVDDVDSARAAIEPMREIGWVHAPEPTDETDHQLSFCTPTVEHRTHHLHVLEESSERWRDWLAFRDYLRAHPDVASEYAALKRDLAEQHGQDPNERQAYRNGKAAFITRVTALARDAAA